ncbi:tyrosine-type recombinase/integrase [Polaribacter sp. AHE13PA]|uniref:tyrosine-type recombinase/integrase n=1 Tax=Polaribacter sp. AHE13PA TaxID=2745562 RepID=UPI001C4E3C7C|nr:tyrosine-type recombinase/integrase [Polaribacter sp. AHE13PA]QXP68458.1 tyrosine-type recombinase/integrase [Polaribacter sp. AHE13PA]
MQSIYHYLTLTTEIEHDFEHDSKVLNLFSSPKIYTAKGDLSKRWYIYFSFRNPKTGKLERMANVYGKVNQYKTKENRMSILSSYRKNLLFLLKQGFNPFIDNSELYEQLKNHTVDIELEETLKEEAISPSKINESVKNAVKEALDENMITSLLENVILKGDLSKTTKKPIKNNQKEIHKKEQNTGNKNQEEMSIVKAFDFALSLKEKAVSSGTLKDYKRKAKLFIIWMEETHPTKKNIREISRKDLLDYFNGIVLKTSARNRNNYRTELGSIFQVLKNNELVAENYIQSIPVLKSKTERNKVYTLKEQQNIFEYLEKQDQLLLLFIKFVSYSFIRPIEVCRIRIKDINLETKTVQFKAKNSPLKTKIIPSILFDELPDLSKLDKESFLFTPETIGAFWDANETNRRDHFSKRFRKVVKDHFKLNEDYGIYSFRHTFISKLYRKLRENASPFEAKSNLMLITGHKSMSALEKYLREIDAELPEDYSKLFK